MADLNILENVASQYGASLAMLGRAIELCPESLWLDAKYKNRFWHVAYHALFYTHLYLAPSEAEFRPWARHQPDGQYLAKGPGTPYSKAEIFEYLEFCRAEVEIRVPALDLAAESGFPWLPFNKLEVQFYNIRHIQHHAGQLAERLRNEVDVGLEWVRPG